MAMTAEEKREYWRKYREANKEKKREDGRRCYAKNKEKKREGRGEYARKYYAENKEKIRDYMNKYYAEWKAANPDKVLKYRQGYSEQHKEARRKWNERNPEKVAVCKHRAQTKRRYPPELVEVKLMQLKIQALLRTGETA